VLKNNDKGYVAAAHVFVANDGYTKAINTGYAHSGPGIELLGSGQAPEAASVVVWSLLVGSVALCSTRRPARAA
jgi:hypothetical protein